MAAGAAVALVLGQVEIERVSHNGTGIYCRGCAAMLDAMHELFVASQHRWREPGFKVGTVEFAKAHCAAASKRGDEKDIARACAYLQDYAGVIGPRHFNGGPPTDSNLFERTSRVCIDELGLCYAPEAPPPELLAGGGSQHKKRRQSAAARRCVAVATLAADLFDVFTTLEVSQLGARAVREHAQAVVGGACPRLARRFPAGGALSSVEEACQSIVDEHDDALVALLAAASSNVGTIALDRSAIGRLAGCTDLGSLPVWSSPWATREAVGAAREAVEAGQMEPSALFTRLNALPDHELLDASEDPEGRGRSALRREPKAGKRKAKRAKPQKMQKEEL
eukprot:2754707-Prymnesium_polylepis.1